MPRSRKPKRGPDPDVVERGMIDFEDCWNPQENETPTAYIAFRLYAMIDPAHRTITNAAKLHKAYRDGLLKIPDDRRIGNNLLRVLHNTDSYSIVSEWAAKFNWKARLFTLETKSSLAVIEASNPSEPVFGDDIRLTILQNELQDGQELRLMARDMMNKLINPIDGEYDSKRGYRGIIRDISDTMQLSYELQRRAASMMCADLASAQVIAAKYGYALIPKSALEESED